MRVTNSMMVSNFMNNLNTNMNKLSGLQGQLATNRKYNHISDDPVSVIYSQQARQKLFTLEHYQSNVDMGQSWLTQVETGVMEINTLLQTAYEQAVDASTDVKGAMDKEIVSKYVGQLRDQVLTVLNSTLGDKYIFGGYNTTGYIEDGNVVTPFGYKEEYTLIDDTLPDDESNRQYTGRRLLTYNGLDISDPANAATIDTLKQDVPTFDMGPGVRMEVSYNGVDVMSFEGPNGPTNIYNLLDELAHKLANGGSTEEITEFIKPLQEAQNHVLTVTAELGGRSSRLELMASRYEQDELNYTQMKSDAEDADQAELIMNYKMAEAVYQAALATGSYVIQPTLMDFLR